MTFLFLIFILALIAIVTMKTMKNKRFPSNNYTPYDEIVSGKKEGTNHLTHYEEKQNR
ncbi:hypothetical protein [Bacillus pinisoli]|uniref:hypothetical protein n=1 Tax=Bacillus pinisoli TaxID=2901866 RepID=UPI001FF5F0E7|nr:hypothetical protein [Bacillus pinisoli]